MRIKQNVRHHPTLSKRHVLSWPQSAQNALLSVTAGKFISDSWIPRDSYRDTDAFEFPTARIITTHFDVVHNTIFFTPREKKKAGNKVKLFVLFVKSH